MLLAMLVTASLAYAACAFAIRRRSLHCLRCLALLSIVYLPYYIASCLLAAAR
jgi:hypothetical protein